MTLSAEAAIQQCGSGGVFVSAHRTVSICVEVERSTDALEGACPFLCNIGLCVSLIFYLVPNLYSPRWSPAQPRM